MKIFEVEMKSKTDFVWCHIPKVKVNASDKTDATYKAMDIADRRYGFRKIAIEVINVEEI